MAITVYIPGPLRPFSGGRPQVELKNSPATLRDALDELWKDYPGIRDRVVTEEGRLREHINIFVGKETCATPAISPRGLAPAPKFPSCRRSATADSQHPF